MVGQAEVVNPLDVVCPAEVVRMTDVEPKEVNEDVSNPTEEASSVNKINMLALCSNKLNMHSLKLQAIRVFAVKNKKRDKVSTALFGLRYTQL